MSEAPPCVAWFAFWPAGGPFLCHPSLLVIFSPFTPSPMKKLLLSSWLLLLACALLGGLPAARASHLLGCDMTYNSLGGNQYRVNFRLYRDSSGASTPSSFDLERFQG